MNYTETIDYIHSLPRGLESVGLDRMRALCAALGNPQEKTKFVHVAGTNGKGSTCAMLDSILRAAGHKTGLYTSPYIHRFNERIRVGGECITDDELVSLAEYVREKCAGLEYSQFEFVTALAFEYFARKKCKVVVLETGLGGRLDPTNVISEPLCSVITAIGLDHTAVLGDTIIDIAAEKAGIIKEGCPVAFYPSEDDEVVSLVARTCREKGCALRMAEFDEIEVLSDSLEGQVFCYCDDTPLTLPLLGDHQTRNAAVVLETVELLRENGIKIKPEALEKGLAETVWPARFELVSEKPCVIVDGGHNVQCAEAIAANLDYYFDDTRRVLLIGMMRDKDCEGVVELLAPLADAFVCVAPDAPRALAANELAKMLQKYEKPTFTAQNITEGVKTAVGAAGKNGMVCACGSLYIVGEVREYFGKEFK